MSGISSAASDFGRNLAGKLAGKTDQPEVIAVILTSDSAVSRMQGETFVRSAELQASRNVDRQISAIADMALKSFDRGLSFPDAAKLGYTALDQIRALGRNPVANFTYDAARKAGSSEAAYKILRSGLERPNLMAPSQGIERQISAISEISRASFERELVFTDAANVGYSALDHIRSLDPNPIANFARDAARKAGSSEAAYKILRSALDRPEALNPYHGVERKIAGISEISRASFERGLVFTDAANVGYSALDHIRSLDPNPVANFARNAAAKAGTSEDAYKILRSAIDRPGELNPYHSLERKTSAISRIGLDSFKRGLSFPDAANVGYTAMDQIEALTPNPIAQMSRQAARQVSTSEEAYRILRTGLEQLQ